MLYGRHWPQVTPRRPTTGPTLFEVAINLSYDAAGLDVGSRVMVGQRRNSNQAIR
jgi:hypothetical protein